MTATCEGKQSFDTYTKGHKAVTRIRKFNGERGPIALYRCPYCPAWHVGAKDKSQKSK